MKTNESIFDSDFGNHLLEFFNENVYDADPVHEIKKISAIEMDGVCILTYLINELKFLKEKQNKGQDDIQWQDELSDFLWETRSYDKYEEALKLENEIRKSHDDLMHNFQKLIKLYNYSSD